MSTQHDINNSITKRARTGFISRLASTPRRKRFMAGSAILLTAILASFSIFATAPEPVIQETLEKAWPVSTLQVVPEELAPVFNTFGRVESNNIAELRTDVIAEVAAIYVREGQWVEEGELLLELRKDELQLRVNEKAADLAQQKAQLDSVNTEYRLLKDTSEHFESVWQLSQKKLKRQEELVEKRMISQAMLDDAVQAASQATIAYQVHVRTMADFPSKVAQQQARVDRAEAQWSQALINLGKTEVRAPFGGPVLEVKVAVGDHSALSTPLVVMADDGEFVIRAPVPNIYAQRFRTYISNDLPIASHAEIGGKIVKLELERLASDVKPGQSGLDAFFRVQTFEQALLPEIGRIINMTVTLPTEFDVVALPVQSIYENDRIYQVRDDRLEAITISKVGDYRTADGEYRVLVRSSSLEAGQQIITTQLPRAISGLLVAPIEAS
jgi:multidrug efflux pump subunit AcrA (membrane-fusion protein)